MEKPEVVLIFSADILCNRRGGPWNLVMRFIDIEEIMHLLSKFSV